MNAPDFIVGGRIFATLVSAEEGYGNLVLTPEIQAELVRERPEVYLPIRGGWGRMDMTHVRLDVIGGRRAARGCRVGVAAAAARRTVRDAGAGAVDRLRCLGPALRGIGAWTGGAATLAGL